MAGQREVRLAVDVAGEGRRWLFVVNRPAGPGRKKEAEAGSVSEPGLIPELRVSLWPSSGRRERKALEQELQEVLGPLADKVILEDGELFLTDSKNEVLPSVDEGV
jgi:hypothetical protein